MVCFLKYLFSPHAHVCLHMNIYSTSRRIRCYNKTIVLNSVSKKTGHFLENGLLLIRFLLSFYELMPEHQPIRKKMERLQ